MGKFLPKLLPWLVLASILIVAWAARTWNREQIFVGKEVHFVDADCYSRMTRVQYALSHPFPSIRHHTFENAPFGTYPHTTAPMDMTISALTVVLLPFSPDPVNLAGALISPLLGLALIGFLGWWSWHMKLPYAGALLLVAAISPILAHGFLLGRPDHQSLILLLVGMALAAEISLWKGKSPGWGILSAASWALALWTSLFEPLILLAAIIPIRFFVLGRRAFTPLGVAAPVTFFGILLLALLFDGARLHPLPEETKQFFERWAQTIGELRHLTFSQLIPWTGWLLPIVPVLLITRFVKQKDRLDLGLAALVLLTLGLSLWYARWGYFLALTFAFSLPFALRFIPWKPAAWALLLVSLWPMAAEWENQLYPDGNKQAGLAEQREDFSLLHDTANALKDKKGAIILAPWWLSPALAYWSGHSCVAGSSHQSLPGTVDSARFYLSTDAKSAREILDKRSVTHVIAYEPSRVIGNSQQILGTAPFQRTLVEVLYTNPYGVPKFLRLSYSNKYFKVYEVIREQEAPDF